MPVAFPPGLRGHPAIQAKSLIQKPFDYIPAPNMGNPGVRFTFDTLDGGLGKIIAMPNSRSPGVNFAKVYLQHDSEPRPQVFTDAKLFKENDGALRTALTGVSRDSTGAALGACQIMAFRTVDKLLVGETISDGSGNWSLDLLVTGPFFLVEYKDGGTPVAGTSLNTLTPVRV